MASDNHANYAKIGFAILAGTVATVLTLVYLGGLQGRQDELLVETYYDREVSGLSVGSTVNFRGVKIGEVREINLVGNKYQAKGDDNLRIYILIALDTKKLGYLESDKGECDSTIRRLVKERGLRASVTASGVTGLSRIECDLYENPPTLKKISWTPAHAVVPQRISLLANFSDAATRVMNQINGMDFAAVWSNVSASVDSLSKTMKTAETVMETRQSDLEKITENFTEISSTLRDLTRELKQNPSLLIRERVPAPLDETK